MMSFPIEIMMGRLGANEILLGFGMVAVWVAVLFTVYKILCARVIRQFSAFGA